jgi:uncharacterized protein (DUF488 family)
VRHDESHAKVVGMTRVPSRGVTGAGYEGREIAAFVAELANRGVTRLVDVRLTPISRKPGFSKTALREALDGVGITYEHRRELGNPKDNRPGFAGSEHELSSAKQAYARRLAAPEAQAALEQLLRYAEHEHVAVLCFEADQHRCHRDVVLRELAGRRAGQ